MSTPTGDRVELRLTWFNVADPDWPARGPDCRAIVNGVVMREPASGVARGEGPIAAAVTELAVEATVPEGRLLGVLERRPPVTPEWSLLGEVGFQGRIAFLQGRLAPHPD